MCIEALKGDIEQIIDTARDNNDTPSDTAEQITGKVERYIDRGWL
jgi:hypothetical protein